MKKEAFSTAPSDHHIVTKYNQLRKKIKNNSLKVAIS